MAGALVAAFVAGGAPLAGASDALPLASVTETLQALHRSAASNRWFFKAIFST